MMNDVDPAIKAARELRGMEDGITLNPGWSSSFSRRRTDIPPLPAAPIERTMVDPFAGIFHPVVKWIGGKFRGPRS